MFSMVHGGAWIGHLHHLAPHQLCSLNQPTRTNYTCKRCKTMEQCHQYQLKLEFWSHVYPQTIHPHCTVCVQFVMRTGEWNDDCFLYWVPSYHLRTSSPSSLSPRPGLLCWCQRRWWISFLLGILPAPHDSPELGCWVVSANFVLQPWHFTAPIKAVLEIFILPTTTIRNVSLWLSEACASRIPPVVSESFEQSWCSVCCHLKWNRGNQHLCSRWLRDAMCNTLCFSGSFVSHPESGTGSSLRSAQVL